MVRTLVIVCALVQASCIVAGPQPSNAPPPLPPLPRTRYPYQEKMRQPFMDACMRYSNPRSVCACVYEEIQYLHPEQDVREDRVPESTYDQLVRECS